MGSAFIPSTFTQPAQSTPSAADLPAAPAASCEACRISGTLTFAAVGAYALTVARGTAKTPATRNGAVVAGVGEPVGKVVVGL